MMAPRNNRDINNKYTTQRNNFNVLHYLSETLTPNDEYENFMNALMDATAECVSTKLRAKHRVQLEDTISYEKVR